MNWRGRFHVAAMALIGAGIVLCASLPAAAGIQGLTGTTFNFTAKADYLSTPDGTYLYFWGFASDDGANPAGPGQAQYPGPTLIVAAGSTVTIHLTNTLPEPVSMIFPGLTGPTTPVYDGSGKLRSLAHEAAPSGGTATYTFTATNPGTYYYESGTHLDKQVALGLCGAIVVRPATPGRAYDHADSAFDREYLLVLTDIDDRLNEATETGGSYDSTGFIPGYWTINGRMAMDTMSDSYVPWLPAQPYDALVRMHPGERLLVRLVNLGRDPHPFHTHGNHLKILARDGRLLESTPGAGADLAEQHFTVNIGPGQTWDGIFLWSAAGLGWDVYGHLPTDPTQPNEYLPDHGKPVPVTTPYFTAVSYGEWYSGSPYLGRLGPLPPDLTRENETGAYLFMWHSHRENEMTNKNDFPGGMMTLMMVEAPWIPIP